MSQNHPIDMPSAPEHPYNNHGYQPRIEYGAARPMGEVAFHDPPSDNTKAPFGVTLLMNILISPFFHFFTFMWSVLSLAFSAAFFIFFPIGPSFFMFSALTWQILGRVDFTLHNMLLPPRMRARIDTPLVKVPSIARPFFSCDGFWLYVKAFANEKTTWTSVMYFIFVRFALMLASFILVFVTLVLGVVFSIYWAVILGGCEKCKPSYHDHDDDGSNSGDEEDSNAEKRWYWITDEWSHALILIPFGIFLLFVCVKLSHFFFKTSCKFSHALFIDNETVAASQPLVARNGDVTSYA